MPSRRILYSIGERFYRDTKETVTAQLRATRYLFAVLAGLHVPTWPSYEVPEDGDDSQYEEDMNEGPYRGKNENSECPEQ